LEKYGPNKIGSASLYLAKKILKQSPSWNSYLQELSGFSEDSLKEASKKICKKYIDLVFNQDLSKKQRLVIVELKFSDRKYNKASLIKP
jgi:hypothetical protein